MNKNDSKKIKNMSDIEEALKNIHTYDEKPLSDHDREVVKQFLIDKYLK